MTELHVVPTPPPSIRVVEDLFDALKALDLERALSLLSDDIVYENVPFPPDRGKAAVRRTLNMMGNGISEFDVRMHNIVERDGVVLTERTDLLRGKWLDLEFWCCGTFEVENGKIRVWRDRFDVGTVLLQLVSSPLRLLLGRLGVAG